MPAPLVRSALIVVVPVAGALAVTGALALRVPGVITMLVAAVLVGAVTAGMAGEAPGGGPRTALDAGVRAAGWTAGALLVLTGVAALAGGLVAVLAGATAGAAVLAVRLRRAGRAAAAAPLSRPAPLRPAPVHPAPVHPAPARPAGPTLLMPPVGGLGTRTLGDEWLRTTALLDARLDPVIRRAIVARRESLLDELERRDPAGFARWLADGPALASDPAEHVRDLPAAGTGAA